LENIIGSAVRSNAEVNASVACGARFLRGGGAILGAAGLAVSAYGIAQTPSRQRGDVVRRQVVGFAGGLIGSEIAAGLLAVGAGLLAATPPGWVVIGVGLVGGIAGGIIADAVIFAPHYETIGRRMGAGYAVDPKRPLGGGAPAAGPTGVTVLPVIRRVVVTIQRTDTQLTLSCRAYLQAALSIGLSVERASAFARRHATAAGLRWLAGDPSPRTDAAMRSSDIAATAGSNVIFELSRVQRDELAALAAAL
jgi:hypothetical protein